MVERWYCENTTDGQKAIIEQQSKLNKGLERTVTVYTADGEILARYTGKIDIENSNNGYVVFNFEGKQYTYYNCFIEDIVNIDV